MQVNILIYVIMHVHGFESRSGREKITKNDLTHQIKFELSTLTHYL